MIWVIFITSYLLVTSNTKICRSDVLDLPPCHSVCQKKKSNLSITVMVVCSAKYKTAFCPCKACCWWFSWSVFVLVHPIIPFLNSSEAAISLSLSVANGFLIESPQVVYLFGEVKLERCGQDADLHHAVFFFSLFVMSHVSSRKQCPQSIRFILCLYLVFTPLLHI